jgi:hypothetical protein
MLAGEEIVETPTVTPEWIQQTLRLIAGIDVDAEEAARILPWAEAALSSRAALAQFEIAEVRSSLRFDPTGPYSE